MTDEKMTQDSKAAWLTEAARKTARLKQHREWNTRSLKDIELHAETAIALEDGLFLGFTADELVAAGVVEPTMARVITDTIREKLAQPEWAAGVAERMRQRKEALQ